MPDEAPLREFTLCHPHWKAASARACSDLGRARRRGLRGVCEKPIRQDELEYELEFACHNDDPKRNKVHFHLRCFAAWEFERTKPAN